MIIRHLMIGAAKYLTTFFFSNTQTAYTVQTSTNTTVVKGEPGSVVTFKVTTYNHSYVSPNYQVDGVTKFLNDTFTRTLDGTGQISFVQFLDVGTSVSGNGINIILTITATTIGAIGTPPTVSNSKTT